MKYFFLLLTFFLINICNAQTLIQDSTGVFFIEKSLPNFKKKLTIADTNSCKFYYLLKQFEKNKFEDTVQSYSKNKFCIGAGTFGYKSFLSEYLFSNSYGNQHQNISGSVFVEYYFQNWVGVRAEYQSMRFKTDWNDFTNDSFSISDLDTNKAAYETNQVSLCVKFRFQPAKLLSFHAYTGVGITAIDSARFRYLTPGWTSYIPSYDYLQKKITNTSVRNFVAAIGIELSFPHVPVRWNIDFKLDWSDIPITNFSSHSNPLYFSGSGLYSTFSIDISKFLSLHYHQSKKIFRENFSSKHSQFINCKRKLFRKNS